MVTHAKQDQPKSRARRTHRRLPNRDEIKGAAFKVIRIARAPVTQEVIKAAADFMRIMKVGL